MTLPTVFLPGAAGLPSFWRPVASRLRVGPVKLVGYPGFGTVPMVHGIHSLDDLYAWLLRNLPSGAFHVVAQSMGGVLAARLAIEAPERVLKLVLCATSGGVDVARHGGVDWRDEYLAQFPRVPHWFAADRTDLTDRLGRISAETLLLWSDADRVSPLAVSDLLLRLIPRSRRHIVARGSHAFAAERVEEVAAALRGFLAPAR